ncbi:hypothetical protein MMC19_006778 [Ptychographa xylographoides]|nr:hypothetical protein [Ptychographa xylographoides]
MALLLRTSVPWRTSVRSSGRSSCYRIVCADRWLGPSRSASNFASQAPPDIGPQVEVEEGEGTDQSDPKRSTNTKYASTAHRMFESAASTFASLTVLALAGYGYHKYYKYLVLQKMENAFKPGDPVLELASLGGQVPTSILAVDNEHWLRRPEQAKIDAIVNGTDRGHYYLLIGEKGTGKSSMLLDAMQKIGGEGVSWFEAHADLEIFRIRLGKALDFEFHEDYIGSLFSIRGPRDTTALLDIERAFNKLEKVALMRRRTIGRPLVLIINSTHLLRDDEDGRDLLELIQQRAEQWSASNLITVILNSDDYWVYERLKGLATRMDVLPVPDLPKSQALAALRSYRARYFQERLSSDILNTVYDKVGGRITFLNRVAKASDMIRECNEIYEREKSWLLNKCWILGEEMDDDVMDQQKYCSAALVLAFHLVSLSKVRRHDPAADGSHILPEIPLHLARQVMTRADFIQSYDHINIFTIDSRGMVRADSVPMQRAFEEICGEEGFREHLEKTLKRISEIESLGRTRELVAKDLVGGWRSFALDIRGGRDNITAPVGTSPTKSDLSITQ